MKADKAAGSPWIIFRYPAFGVLWLATVVSNIGTWMQHAAAGWLMTGLNDSHIHVIRGGPNCNMELRWDGVPSLADALRLLKEQAARTPAPQWVRVVGGWTELQFAERRMPTLEEIKRIESVLTILGGKVVYAAGEFRSLAPPPLSVSPGWSPVNTYGGYHRFSNVGAAASRAAAQHVHEHRKVLDSSGRLWRLGCDCFAF